MPLKEGEEGKSSLSPLTMQHAFAIVGGDLQQEGVLQGLLPSAVPTPQGLCPLAAGADLL